MFGATKIDFFPGFFFYFQVEDNAEFWHDFLVLQLYYFHLYETWIFAFHLPTKMFQPTVNIQY